MKNTARQANAQLLHGFTLVELIISMAIVSIALLGIYSLLVQIAQVERRITLETVSQDSLAGLVEHVGVSLKYSVTYGDRPEIVLSKDINGVAALECQTMGMGYRTTGIQQSGVVLQRFTWGFPASSELAGTMQYQEIGFAGSTPITLSPELAQDLEVVWSSVPSLTIARGLSSFIVLASAINGPDVALKTSYSGTASDAIFQIRAQMGGQTVERYEH